MCHITPSFRLTGGPIIGPCHTAVRDVLSWVFVLSVSCFILKSNSPLVSGPLPFLVCHLSDVIPDS